MQDPSRALNSFGISATQILKTIFLKNQPKLRSHHGLTIPTVTLMERLTTTVTKIYATATWRTKASLQARFLQFIARRHLPYTDSAAALFAMQTTSPKTRLSHAVGVRSLLRAQGMAVPLMDLAIAGLQRLVAPLPLRQALPMTPEVIKQLVSNAPLCLRAGLMICWKTASRWGEVALLSRSSVIASSPSEVIISWGTATKTTKRNPFRPQNYTVIRGRWTNLIHEHFQKNVQATSYSTEDLRRYLAQHAPSHTAHSLKRGALLEATAIVEKHDLPLILLSRLAKHQADADLPTTTVRYSSGPALARALGTGRITKFL